MQLQTELHTKNAELHLSLHKSLTNPIRDGCQDRRCVIAKSKTHPYEQVWYSICEASILYHILLWCATLTLCFFQLHSKYSFKKKARKCFRASFAVMSASIGPWDPSYSVFSLAALIGTSFAYPNMKSPHLPALCHMPGKWGAAKINTLWR